jgi:hypothetical protein
MELGVKNLSGKAFRFGIFWNRFQDPQGMASAFDRQWKFASAGMALVVAAKRCPAAVLAE